MMMFTMIASMFLSNTTTTAMVVASLMPMISHFGRSSPVSKALILGIPVAATIGGMGMVIGCPSNMMTAAAIVATGSSISFFKWMVYGMPLMLGFTFLTGWLLSRTIKGEDQLPENIATKDGQKKGTTAQRVIVLTVLFVTIGFWVSSPLHGISASAISAIPLVMLPMASILDKTDIRGMGWDALILIAGGLALGEGLKHSGLLQIYADRIAALPISPLMLMMAIAYITMILSNVMGATATCAILLPVGISLVPENVVGISMIVGLAASIAILLPVSSPPNAIAYNTGVIKQSDFLIAGKVVALVGPALVVLWVLMLS
jgi:sodium-dependent dicarboxylate transporter 2/3/5